MAKLTSARTITSAKTFGPTGWNWNPRLHQLDSGTQRVPWGLKPASSGYPCAPWLVRPPPSRVSPEASSLGPSSSTPQLATVKGHRRSFILCLVCKKWFCINCEMCSDGNDENDHDDNMSVRKYQSETLKLCFLNQWKRRRMNTVIDNNISIMEEHQISNDNNNNNMLKYTEI